MGGGESSASRTVYRSSIPLTSVNVKPFSAFLPAFTVFISSEGYRFVVFFTGEGS